MRLGPGQSTLIVEVSPLVNQSLAPTVPAGAARPFAPGEYLTSPDKSWSSELSMTVMGDPSFNNGQPTVIPSLWIKDGKPYVAKDEAEAIELAKASGLAFQGFPTLDAAESFSTQREKGWQGMEPSAASKNAPLYQPPPDQYIEPPAKVPQLTPASASDALSAVPSPGRKITFP